MDDITHMPKHGRVLVMGKGPSIVEAFNLIYDVDAVYCCNEAWKIFSKPPPCKVYAFRSDMPRAGFDWNKASELPRWVTPVVFVGMGHMYTRGVQFTSWAEMGMLQRRCTGVIAIMVAQNRCANSITLVGFDRMSSGVLTYNPVVANYRNSECKDQRTQFNTIPRTIREKCKFTDGRSLEDVLKSLPV